LNLVKHPLYISVQYLILMKGGVDGFSYFHWLSAILFSKVPESSLYYRGEKCTVEILPATFLLHDHDCIQTWPIIGFCQILGGHRTSKIKFLVEFSWTSIVHFCPISYFNESNRIKCFNFKPICYKSAVIIHHTPICPWMDGALQSLCLFMWTRLLG
jgi:hypothetical protein